MDRVSRRCLAALRLLLVAVSVCLLGAAPFAERDSTRREARDPQAHAEAVGLPAPGPAVVEESDEDPRSAEDDELGHDPRPGLALIASVRAHVTSIRGPPTPRGDPVWQPRSSRGPPAPI